MTEAAAEVVRPETPEVQVGREIAMRLIDSLGQLIEKHNAPEAIYLRDEAAQCLIAYFAHCGRPPALPVHVLGIPLRVGQTGGKAVVLVMPSGRTVEH